MTWRIGAGPRNFTFCRSPTHSPISTVPSDRPPSNPGRFVGGPLPANGPNVGGRFASNNVWQPSGYRRVGGNRSESRRVAFSAVRGPLLLTIVVSRTPLQGVFAGPLSASRPGMGREPKAAQQGSENRWLCQLRSAVGPAGQRELNSGSRRKRTPLRRSRSSRRGKRWDRVEGRNESMLQARLRSCDRGGPEV